MFQQAGSPMRTHPKIEGYRILERLGSGGAADVYLATPVDNKDFAKIGEPVAVKLYNQQVLRDKNQLQRVRREFETGSKVFNPDLVRIYDFNLTDPHAPYLVMEYVDGMPLSEWIKMFFPISERLLVDILARIAKAIKALHEAQRIHRDIKPENIMMSVDFDPKVMDFGVVKVKDISGGTPPDSFLGTIRNAAPEWLTREEAEDAVSTDLYSFGTVVYVILHGHQVFAHEKQFAKLVQLVKEERPKFDEGLRNRPEPIPTLTRLAEHLLEKEPRKRPASMDEILPILNKAGSSLSPGSLKPLHGYIATALTGVTKDAREAMAFKSSSIAAVCKEFNIYIYQPRKATDPLLHPDVEPEAVYARDRKRVLGANLLIIIADNPSFGVGQEIEIAAGFGVPTIIVTSGDASSKLSRMVTGSFLNLIGQITYRTPEDLVEKMRELVGNNLDRIRSFKRSTRPDAAISQRIGSRLREMRQHTGLSISDAAKSVGTSARLLKALEERPLNYHNVSLHIVGRLLVTYGCNTSDLFEATAPIARSPRTADHNIRSLESVASKMSWSVADYLQLRDDYERTLAAAGDTERIDEESWLQRHSALEKRKMQDNRAKTDATRQEELFG
jgi:serine/threonine protein kinase/transcriptional regulator with XRE-family HTH domain